MKALWIFKLFPSKVRGRSTHIRADIQIKLKKKRVMSSINYQLSARTLIFSFEYTDFFKSFQSCIFTHLPSIFFCYLMPCRFFLNYYWYSNFYFMIIEYMNFNLFYYITPIFFIVQIKWFMYLIENCEKNRCT